jgi:hypothetical protein
VSEQHLDGPHWLRPVLTSTLYPLLPRRSEAAFGVALLGIVALLIATATSRWQPSLIVLVCLAVPLLFVAYLYEIDVVARLSRAAVLVTAGVGTGLGVGWALGTDAAIARAANDALGIPVSTTRLFVTLLAIPLGYLVCLLVPALLIRIWRPGVRNPLHGYAIGALGAYCFVGAGTLTRLAPSFVAGLDTENTRSTSGLVVAAVVQGVADPVTAAAVAGAVGATLWFRPAADARQRASWSSPTSPAVPIAFAVIAYLGLGLLDFVAVPFAVEMAIYVLLAVLATLLLRTVLHATLGQEPRSTTASTATLTPRTGAVRLLTAIGLAAVVLVVTSVAVSAWLTPPEPTYVCPPDCGRPPISAPVATNPRFTPDTGEFSVSYPGEETAYEATFQPNGVVLELLAGEGGVLRLFGQPAEGRSAREIAKQLIADHYRGATFAYEIPNALVGYHLGYGEVADVFPTTSVTDEGRARVLVMVAVKNDYALIAAGAGPFQEFSPEFGSGHPSGANFLLALDMGKYVNSFSWRGDPPR